MAQTFDHFLNSAGPSTPRGRGRGGGGRGRGGGRGGRGGLSSGGGSNVKKSDYSNVPFDYASINSQRYNKMDGFVQPFGPSDSPSSRGSPLTRGRGRGGRGGLGANATTASPRVKSGSSTPVRGIGHRSRGGGLGSDRPSSGYKGKSTVGREGVTWGGRGAPIFVKSGELFKDGEVDIIRKDEDDEITIETVPLSDPSAPQMTNLKDDTEIEVMQTEAMPEVTDIAEPDQRDDELAHSPVLQHSDPAIETITTEVDIDMTTEDSPSERLETTILPSDEAQLATRPAETMAVEVAESPELPSVPAPISAAQVEEELDSMFFVDTEPALVEEDPFYIDTQPGNASSSTSKPKYHASSSHALGHREDVVSSDEEIVFAPKTYKQPQPINVNMSQASGSRPARTTAPEPKRSVALEPKISRAQKKAAKKEKKKKGGKKSKRLQRQPELVDGSDIEWGSDGLPRGAEIIGIEGVDESDGEHDVAVLRDYLEGTLLNAKTGSGDEMDDDQELDSDEVDEAIDIEMMRQFGAGVKQWNDDGSAGSASGDDSEDQEPDSEEDDDSHMEDVSGSDSDDEEETIDVDALEAEVAAEQDIDRQLAIALEKGEEDSDIEELFTGKSGWGDETDWFLQSMTDALDPKAVSYKNRKSNSKLFHAIENGNFDDFDLSVEPSKKKKNNKHVPAELQVQWNKDREAKAEKKRQRAMDRLMVELDPYPSARKRKNKGKGKDIAQAASMAHLIPASAAEVAEMFDISSGEDEDSPGIWKNKRQGLLPDISETWMSQVNSQVQEFLQDGGKTTFSLPPMAKDGRMKIHMLAECYGLVSKSKGGGRGRFTILYKNTRSGQSVDYAQIDRLVKASQAPGGLFYKNYFGGKKANGKPNKFDKSGKGKKTGKFTTAHGNGNMPSLRARDGEEVGGGAERIGMDNVGHRLLSRMGWADGDRIGKSGGLEAPIMAIVKNTKSGLGA